MSCLELHLSFINMGCAIDPFEGHKTRFKRNYIHTYSKWDQKVDFTHSNVHSLSFSEILGEIHFISFRA